MSIKSTFGPVLGLILVLSILWGSLFFIKPSNNDDPSSFTIHRASVTRNAARLPQNRLAKESTGSSNNPIAARPQAVGQDGPAQRTPQHTDFDLNRFLPHRDIPMDGAGAIDPAPFLPMFKNEKHKLKKYRQPLPIPDSLQKMALEMRDVDAPREALDVVPWWTMYRPTIPYSEGIQWNNSVVQKTSQAVGLNNQRQQIHVAFIAAIALNRTLVLSKYMANRHDKVGTGFEEYYDLDDMANAVPVEAGSKFDGIRRELSILQYSRTPYSPEISGKNMDAPYIGTGLYWGFPKFMFQFGPSLPLLDNLERLYFHPTQRLFDIAAKAIRYLHTQSPKLFHAVHMRVGDRRPLPMLDCGRWGLSEVPAVEGNCAMPNSAIDKRTSIEVLFLDLLPKILTKGDLLYIATNSRKNVQVAMLESELESHNISTMTLGQVPTVKDDLAQLTSGQLGVIDQIVCAYAQRFFATFPSSWDEYVVDIRRWLGMPHAQEDSAVYLYKTAWKMYFGPVVDIHPPPKKAQVLTAEEFPSRVAKTLRKKVVDVLKSQR